jgi:hypothetical protein
MCPAVTTGLVVAATAIHGLLAGGNFDRLFVQMPAFRRVGVRAWAASAATPISGEDSSSIRSRQSAGRS